MEPKLKCLECGTTERWSSGVPYTPGDEPCASLDCDGEMVPIEEHPDHTPKPGDIVYVEDFKGAVTGGGYKASMDDPKKVPLSLIDPEYLLGTGRVLQHGAKKYAPGNWMKGMSWQEVLSALQRHTLAIQNGEDRDPETGELHAYHVSCCAMFLARFMSHNEYAKFDDRLFKPLPNAVA